MGAQGRGLDQGSDRLWGHRLRPRRAVHEGHVLASDLLEGLVDVPPDFGRRDLERLCEPQNVLGEKRAPTALDLGPRGLTNAQMQRKVRLKQTPLLSETSNRLPNDSGVGGLLLGGGHGVSGCSWGDLPEVTSFFTKMIATSRYPLLKGAA